MASVAVISAIITWIGVFIMFLLLRQTHHIQKNAHRSLADAEKLVHSAQLLRIDVEELLSQVKEFTP